MKIHINKEVREKRQKEINEEATVDGCDVCPSSALDRDGLAAEVNEFGVGAGIHEHVVAIGRRIDGLLDGEEITWHKYVSRRGGKWCQRDNDSDAEQRWQAHSSSILV